MTESSSHIAESNAPRGGLQAWVTALLLVGILMIAAYFRLVGINWDENHHLHPDERFLTMVATSVAPVQNLGEYFDTQVSSLNPHNRGHGFYVYGTLPLFLVRYAAEWVGMTGYDEVHLVGRFLSAAADLLTVLLVFLIAARLFSNTRLGLLAAAFSACSVLPIQLSHYFTVDTFTNFFSLLTFYFAVRVMMGDWSPGDPAQGEEAASGQGEDAAVASNSAWGWLRAERATLIPYVLFGLALGMAVASKVSVAPLALLLPAAVWIYYLRLSPAEQERQKLLLLRNLVVAALVSLVVFRICQPYAFSGPGFFGLKPNPLWVSNLRELSLQSAGDVDFPPALQWARRPLWFAWENMVKWGLGLPLGLLAWAGFLWMGWRILKGAWQPLILIWGWTAVYFCWQSLNFTRSMRYQLPVYPTLAVIAAWAVFELWKGHQDAASRWAKGVLSNWRKIAAFALGLGVLAATLGWAFAFSRIYTRPVTRVAASRWIYQNVPTVINLNIEAADGVFRQLVPFRNNLAISSEAPLVFSFIAEESGVIDKINFAHLVERGGEQPFKELIVEIAADLDEEEPLVVGYLADDFKPEGDPRGKSFTLQLERPMVVERGERYFLRLEVGDPQDALTLSGQISLGIATPEKVFWQYLPEAMEVVRPGQDYTVRFNSLKSGKLSGVFLPHIVDLEARPGEKKLRLTVNSPVLADGFASAAEISADFWALQDPRGEGYTAAFDRPFEVAANVQYEMRISLVEGEGSLALYGSRQAIESTWDDSIPMGMEGYSPYDYTMGLYRSELNFEMYWDDNQDKLERFKYTLDHADYIFITSNRQWGTTVRVPERYPLTSEYYRRLIGCPPAEQITWCYSVAEPGMFSGELGFDLVQVFQSDPNLGAWRFNTQFAEEAFTVYDHPKVLIFQKRPDYDSQAVHRLLEAVDLTKVVHLTPRQASNYVGNLMLPADRAARQEEAGTWAELFDRQSWINRFPFVGLLVWYLAATLLGWMVYPFLRLALGGLADRGYPLARLAGMLLLAYIVWLGGSFGAPFNRLTISLALLALLAANGALFIWQRAELRREWQERRSYFVAVEMLALAFFVLFLLIRLGNPDLWHPYKGGEKPMDFSYLNAVLKADTFPPYDPWFSGGYINYYYYGFVLVGVLVKWLGIVPSVAYNLILPALFSMLGLGAFCVGWNLLAGKNDRPAAGGSGFFSGLDSRLFAGGLASAVGLLIVGNLGTVRMIWHGLQRLAAPGGSIDGANFFMRWVWTLQGLMRFLSGSGLPYSPGDWYWIPSRAIPGEPITEFPFFTFLYADPHAHLIALPLTVLALAWAVSILRGQWDWSMAGGRGWLRYAASFFLGALAIGALKPTNTWDFPTYLTLGILVVLYTSLRYGSRLQGISWLPQPFNRLAAAALSALLLAGLALLLYQPFSRWYGQGYNAIEVWEGSRTPFWSYITHWGLFLFLIISWLVWETRDWMAKTPFSALQKLLPYKAFIQGMLVLLLLSVVGLLILGVGIAWLALPLAAWAAVLILRPGQPDAKRFVLFLTGSALVLTLAVELIVLRGDIGRMNTVFKFYLQAWTLFSLSAAAGLIWLLPAVSREWLPGWRNSWQVALGLLAGGALLFPMLASFDKIKDRISPLAPHTLDGMTYMAYARYHDQDREMDLRQDYEAILWMQENIQGTPVIVECNTPEYRWGSRYTIYTGLPGVVGWNWHQRQQRAIIPSEWVTQRVAAIYDFYATTDRRQTQEFIRKYDVRYIVVGQLEKAYHPWEGIAKFGAWEGDLWLAVYQKEDTTIYEVLP